MADEAAPSFPRAMIELVKASSRGVRSSMRVSSALASALAGSCGRSLTKATVSKLSLRLVSASCFILVVFDARSTRQWHGNSNGSRTARNDEEAFPVASLDKYAPRETSFLSADTQTPFLSFSLSSPPLHLPRRRRFSSDLFDEASPCEYVTVANTTAKVNYAENPGMRSARWLACCKSRIHVEILSQ